MKNIIIFTQQSCVIYKIQTKIMVSVAFFPKSVCHRGLHKLKGLVQRGVRLFQEIVLKKKQNIRDSSANSHELIFVSDLQNRAAFFLELTRNPMNGVFRRDAYGNYIAENDNTPR